MEWTEIIPSAMEQLGKLFGIIDKSVTDKDEANKLKLETLKAVVGTGSTNWLQANAFSIAMLCNYAMVVSLTLMGKAVPEWSIVVALAWLAGPLLNGLSKETVGKLMEMAKSNKEGKK
jgi:hypothetical protein